VAGRTVCCIDFGARLDLLRRKRDGAGSFTYAPKTKRVPTAERTTLLGISARTMS
jgi:hypothetical protein